MDRLEKLRVLEAQLAAALDQAETKEVAALARQYRETLREIDLLEGEHEQEDDIAQLLSARANDGKSGAIRPDRS